ncbi:transcriptional regulator [Anopheles sinensis]|uniref:Transcriptional regulator n=1 Tax=Anopheles sinensis TaxID=74873 RepID=A0A084VGE4_ANOSI|nr:transcriptional regulator [Anopheles sinensis]
MKTPTPDAGKLPSGGGSQKSSLSVDKPFCIVASPGVSRALLAGRLIARLVVHRAASRARRVSGCAQTTPGRVEKPGIPLMGGSARAGKPRRALAGSLLLRNATTFQARAHVVSCV